MSCQSLCRSRERSCGEKKGSELVRVGERRVMQECETRKGERKEDREETMRVKDRGRLCECVTWEQIMEKREDDTV